MDANTLPLFDQGSQPTKKCTKCGKAKPLTAEFFHIEKRARDGFRSFCRLCRNSDAVRASNEPGVKERLATYRKSRGTAQSQFDKLDKGKDYYKTCTKCKATKLAMLDNFHLQPLGKYGLASRCVLCVLESATKKRNSPEFKKWYSNNYPRIAEKQKQYTEENRERVLARKRAYEQTIPKEIKNAKAKSLREKNPDHYREYHRKQETEKRKDPAYKLKQRISIRINAMMKNGKAGKTTEEILGYTAQELRVHIEKQFKDGMTLDALMRGEIHIDHKRPIASFHITSIDDPDFKICWGLKNLQPLWAFDNVSKGCRWDG